MTGAPADPTQIPKVYSPAEVENRLYREWESKGYFHAERDGPAGQAGLAYQHIYGTPDRPIGTCMVSSEGACAAYYNFGRMHREAAVTLGRRS